MVSDVLPTRLQLYEKLSVRQVSVSC